MGYKGYGSAGASLKKRATKGFTSLSGSPREDIDENNYTLRQRGRLMYMGNPVATSAIKTCRTNTIGLGLKLNPRPDMAFLGLTTEQASEWARGVKREFSLWASRKDACDAIGMNDFYELQQLLLVSWLTSGDVFVLVKNREPDALRPYGLRLRALEADLITTPTAAGGFLTVTEGKNPANGNRIFDGVEVDSDGLVVAYHIRNTYPYEHTTEAVTYNRIEVIGRQTGEPNILHLMSSERPDQYRGVSFIAPVIIPLLQMNRYTEAELSAAMVNALFTAYVQTNVADGNNPFDEALPDYDGGVSQNPNDYEMGPGQVNFLQPGENIITVDPKHPTSGFDGFVQAVSTQVGAALEIPREILLKQFTASYSASRGALLEAWKAFRMYRTWFINDFCNPVYELWMNEAVARGRVKAPGYFADPAIRAAWLSCQWIGPSQGMLDPEKEIRAEVMACENGFSTHEDSALRLNGSDFSANIEQLVREAEMADFITKEEGNEFSGQDETDHGEDGNGDDEDETVHADDEGGSGGGQPVRRSGGDGSD